MPALREKHGYKNIHEIPKSDQSCREFLHRRRERTARKPSRFAKSEIAMITGQRPIATLAKKSIANFKLRQGQAIGAKVTLRGRMMYEFLERLIKMSLPRIRDFRGVSTKGFRRKRQLHPWHLRPIHLSRKLNSTKSSAISVLTSRSSRPLVQ